MKTYLIKVNSENQRKLGFFWVILDYPDETLTGTFEVINAKQVKFSTPVTTAEHNGGYYIKAYGTLQEDQGIYEIR